ncbi:MAG: ATP-binding protein, partial [Desulfobacteraceae bacterium]|nr:ATP-binding protein [Desulfobacteraceae bacterium]
MMKVKKTAGYVICLKISEPSLENNTADVERIKQAIKKELDIDNIKIGFNIIQKIPYTLRESNHEIKAIVFKDLEGWVLVDILSSDNDQAILGVAADIGTTKIVIRLVNLESKEVLIERGFDNPQIEIGPDVLSRIHFAKDQKGLDKLSSIIIQGFNSNISNLCKKIGCETKDIYLFAGAGNTSMTHLFLGLEPSGIIREPYIPCINIPDTLKADKIGLNLNSNALCFLFPNIGSYFGGDLISGILYSSLNKLNNPSIMVDVGTNAEVIVGCKDWLVACAGAAGPALEGGVSDIGMTAAPGVIDKVSFNKDINELEFTSIENKEPVGVCGSGMIDLAAALFLSNTIDIRGKFIKANCNGKLFNQDGIDYFILVDKEDSGTGDNICISQVDLNSLTSSKA